MILSLTFKTTDVVDEAMREVPEADQAEALEAISRFVKWREYVTIRINTDTGTAEVVRVK